MNNQLKIKENTELQIIYQKFMQSENTMDSFCHQSGIEKKKLKKALDYILPLRRKEIISKAEKNENGLPTEFSINESLKENCSSLFEENFIRKNNFGQYRICTQEDYDKHYREHKDRIFNMMAEIVFKDAIKDIFSSYEIKILLQKIVKEKLEEILSVKQGKLDQYLKMEESQHAVGQ